MSDPSLPLEASLVAQLKAASAVNAIAAGRIYDAPPVNPVFPYVTLGEWQVLPDKSDCIDGTEIFPRIDVWSRAPGFPECKALTAAIVAALDDQPMSVAGYTVVVFELQDIQYLRDPDGLTRHAALTFHALLQLA